MSDKYNRQKAWEDRNPEKVAANRRKQHLRIVVGTKGYRNNKNHYSKWTETEDNMIVCGLEDLQLHDLLGRSVSAIWSRRYYLKNLETRA